MTASTFDQAILPIISNNNSEFMKENRMSHLLNSWYSPRINFEESNLDGELVDSHFSGDLKDLILLGRSLKFCTIKPYQLLYFPAMWMHATVNIDDYNSFFSLFIDYQLI